MKTRRFGRTGHMSTVAIFGAAAFWEKSQIEADAAMEKVIAAGVNHIDVAPFYGAVGYEKHSLDYVTAGANESATKVGFGFSQDMFSVGAVYEKTSDNQGVAQENKYGHNAYYLAGMLKMGLSAVKVAYGKAGVLGTGASQIADSDATMLAVGYDHGLSKRTKLYALYSKISNGKGINYAFTQSSAAGSSNSGFGTSPSVISLGMKHSF